MTTTQKLEAAQDTLGNITADKLLLFRNVRGLRSIVAEKEARAIGLLSCRGNPYADTEALTAPALVLQSVEGLTDARGLIDLAENHPAYLEAVKIVTPLESEVIRLQAQLQSEVEAEGRLAQQKQTALESALAEAVAKVHAQFEDPEKPLVRGRQKLAIELLAQD